MEDDNTETSLSIIDSGIKSLKDLPIKYSLKSINLHSNLISKIENLTFLQNLNHLDLSSNRINKITGLHGLVSLKILNLSCNQIQTIENLEGLKKLVYLNLSYNKIQYINGLHDLWGVEYSLETLLLNSNFISSLEEISYYLNGLVKLKHLSLYDNKFLKKTDYRLCLFKSLKHLQSLDGKDKLNKQVNYKINPESFLDEFINWSKPSSPKVKHNKLKSDSIEEEDETSLSSLGPKLDQIEDKIHKLLYIRDKIKNQDKDFEDLILPKSPPKPILKQSTLINQSTSTTTNELSSNDFNNSSKLNDLIKALQEQLTSYKKSQDDNLNLINELKKKLDDKNLDNFKLIQEKDDQIRKEQDLVKDLNTKLNSLNLKQEQFETKIKKLELNYVSQLAKKEEKLKNTYQSELKSLKEKHEIILKEKLDKVSKLENEYKKLEDEFRSALIIESNRFNDVLSKYESSSNEFNNLKNQLKIYEQNESRNRSLINELNDLIKEQKSRIQILTKARQESSDDLHKHNEKLSEAVSDCVKLKAQNEQLKKDKQSIESNLKKFLTEYEQIKKEKLTWSTKLNDQKNFFIQENNRLESENKKLKSDLDLQTSSLNKEADNCKIKSKIIEDQTETIKKLKQGLIERDEMLKKSREEALNIQKSLEKQLNDEMDLSNELQIKLDKSNEKKEVLKLEIEELNQNLLETKRAHEELSNKWKLKSELISELDTKVRKMKENFELKEKDLIEKNEKLLKENEVLTNRLRTIDDNFRHQYDSEKKEHLKQLEKVKHENVSIIQKYEEKIKNLEDEMRLILIESENKKKFYDEKIQSFTQMFSKFQADFKTNN